MASGTVKWFNAQKGYGFIQPDDGSKDVFVHITAVERAGLSGLNEGQKVSFDLEERPRGTSATNLKPVSEPRAVRPSPVACVHRMPPAQAVAGVGSRIEADPAGAHTA